MRATSYDTRDGITTITLDRSEERNALTPALVNSLGDDLGRAAEDSDCRLIVLTNEGSVFSAGADLKPGREEAPRYSLSELLTAIIANPKPVIGRIAGHCFGGGVGLAAACDLSLCADDVRFGFTEVRLGVAPAVISVVCLPKLRPADALELFLTGEQFGAARAAEVGLVNRALPRPQLDEAVAALASLVLRGGARALAAAKQLVHTVPGMSRAAAFEWTTHLSAELFASPEAEEARAAFRERRPPSWSDGRPATGR